MATTPKIDQVPTPVPQRSDPANFPARGDAMMTAFPTLVNQMNAMAVWTNTQRDLVAEDRTAVTNLKSETEQIKVGAGEEADRSRNEANRSTQQAVRSEAAADKAEEYRDATEELLANFDPTGEGLPDTTVENAPLVIASPQGGVKFSLRALNDGIGIRPALRFDFANQGFLDPRIEFTRLSRDFRDGRTYEVDEPVITDEGLQMVGPRTNLLTQGVDFSKWFAEGGGSIEQKTEDSFFGPPYLFVPKAGEQDTQRLRLPIQLNAGKYVASVVFSASGYTNFRVEVSGTGAVVYDSINEQFAAIESRVQYSGVEKLSEGRVRVWMGRDNTEPVSGRIFVYGLPQGVTSNSYSDYDGVSGVTLHHAQIEYADTPSPMIPTYGNQVTVAKTTLVVPNRGELSNSEGSLILCVDALFRDSGHAYCRLNFAAGGYIGFRYVPTSHYIDVYGWLDGTGTIVDSANTPYQQVRKIGFSYTGREFKLCVNGEAVETLQLRADIPEISSLLCNLSAVTQSITYYNQALTPTQLKELTS